MATLRLPLADPLRGGTTVDLPPLILDPDALEAVAQDAGASRGSGATALVVPKDERQLCAWLRANPSTPVLPQGALTSLTGGAAPSGDVVLSTRKMTGLDVDVTGATAVAGPGLLLADLHLALDEVGLFYPPAPTHDGASVGGNVATNAAGAATFAYGTTRDWVHRIRLVLRHGEVLELRRGAHRIRPGDTLELTGQRTFRLPIPTGLSPGLRKTSAGYHVRDPLDPIDLFIGSEGTLGIVSEVELALLPKPNILLGLVFLPDAARAVALTRELRDRSLATRRGQRPHGMSIRSIEFFDRRCLQLLAQEGKLEDLRVHAPDNAAASLLFAQELPAEWSDREITDRLARVYGTSLREPRDALHDLMLTLHSHDAFDGTSLALPGQPTHQARLAALREAIPLAVSEWLQRHHRRDPAVHKLGGDMIVPFEHFPGMLGAYYRAFESRGLDVCVYGHVSDGNVHPNALPTNADDMAAGEQALMELARQVLDLGGCPLAEHGVGRNPSKHRMLEMTRGPDALREMMNLKRAIDPGWTLARGVLFPPPRP